MVPTSMKLNRAIEKPHTHTNPVCLSDSMHPRGKTGFTMCLLPSGPLGDALCVSPDRTEYRIIKVQF